MARQIDGVAQCCGWFGAGGNDGEVEDGKRDHGANLVWLVEATKTPAAQIRPANEGPAHTRPATESGTRDREFPILPFCPLVERPPSKAKLRAYALNYCDFPAIRHIFNFAHSHRILALNSKIMR
jgi:hypothetical protein